MATGRQFEQAGLRYTSVDAADLFEGAVLVIHALHGQQRAAQGLQSRTDAPAAEDGGGGLMGGLGDILFGSTGPRGGRHEGLAQSMARSAVRTMGTTVGREIIRGVLGSLLGGGSRRR